MWLSKVKKKFWSPYPFENMVLKFNLWMYMLILNRGHFFVTFGFLASNLF